MGGRTVQYFLNFVKNSKEFDGQKWIDDHVHTLFAAGIPWLGAPRPVRGVLSGEPMGLEFFLTHDDSAVFIRSCGSAPFVFPLKHDLLFGNEEENLVLLKDENGAFKSCSLRDILSLSHAPHQWNIFENFYLRNPLFGVGQGQEPNTEFYDNLEILKPPPVKRMVSIYGINLPTEKMYFYSRDQTGKLRLDTPTDISEYQDYKITKGIAFETERTPQKIIQDTTGIEGRRSGDGTVPYASLNYCATWRNSIPQMQIIELPKVEHRSLLNNRVFFKHLIDYISMQNSIS